MRPFQFVCCQPLISSAVDETVVEMHLNDPHGLVPLHIADTTSETGQVEMVQRFLRWHSDFEPPGASTSLVVCCLDQIRALDCSERRC